MKILLVTLPLWRTNSAQDLRAKDDGDNCRVPVGLYSLATILIEKGHEVRLCNHTLTPWEYSVQEVVAFHPDIVGITCMTHQRLVVDPWARQIKSRLPECRIVLGGVHASVLYAEILERWPAIDFVAVGEADESFPRLIQALEKRENPRGINGIAMRLEDGSIDWAGPAPAVTDLGALPLPAERFSYDTIITARGCPFSCTFCCSPQIWGSRVRERPVDHVIRELELLRRRSHLTHVYIKDETFTLRRSRVEEMCRAMIDARLDLWWSCDTRVDCLDEERLYWMRKAGCFYVSFGVESASPRMLKKINKRTDVEKIREAVALARRFGMYVRFYLIGGLPDEGPDDLMATLNLVKETKPHFVCISPLALSPGTEMFREYCERSGKDNWFWFENADETVLYDYHRDWCKTYAGKMLWEMHNIGPANNGGKPYNEYTEEELRAVAEKIPDAYAPAYDLALFLKKAGKFAEAIPFYERTVSLRPGFGKGWIDLGECFDQLGRVDEAVAAWEKVEGIAEESAENVALSLIYRGLVFAAVRGDLPHAVEIWKRAHERLPAGEDSLRIMGQNCAVREDWDNVLWAAEQWTRINAEAAEPYHLLALASMAQGAGDDAVVFFERARKLDPRNANYCYSYSLLFVQAGNFHAAARQLTDCLTLAPGHEAAKNLLAQIQRTK